MSEKDEIDRIAAEIMDYCSRNPMASDSIEGIAHWWLGDQKLKNRIDLIGSALKRLVSEGQISETRNAGRKSIYCLNRPGQKR